MADQLHEQLADLLHVTGWRSPCDAQWTGLRDALPQIRALLAPPPANDGGPAFPRDHASDGHNGMSLRDYFIAHAPAEPQPWFRPVMPTTCPVPPTPLMDMTPEERHDAEGESEGYLHIEEVQSERLRAYITQRAQVEKDKRAWRAEADKQLYVQWPAAWADAMLKARQS